MKRLLTALASVLSLSPAMAGDEAPPATAPAKARLVVRVAPLENAEGELRCALFGSAGGFPDDIRTAKGLAAAKIDPSQKPLSATCVFENVVPGTYAVSVIHDENRNGELDTNLFGIPSEGYAFSRDARGSMGPPAFDAAKVSVTTGTMELTLKPEY